MEACQKGGGGGWGCWFEHFTCVTSLTYSATSLTITSCLLLCPPCLNEFLLFHRLQAMIVKKFQSIPRGFSLTSHTIFKSSLGGSRRRGSLIFVPLQTTTAKLHPYRICPDDSLRPHKSQLSSCLIPLDFKQSFIGRIFLLDLHI